MENKLVFSEIVFIKNNLQKTTLWYNQIGG